MTYTTVTGSIREDTTELDENDGWLPSEQTITVTDRALYHWAPRDRRRQIERYGLRPSMRPTITTPDWRAPYVCFADDAAWAWSLSGGMPHHTQPVWDLWQTYLGWMPEDALEFLEAFPDDQRDFHEVRVHARVFKRHLIWIAERTVADAARGRRGPGPLEP